MLTQAGSFIFSLLKLNVRLLQVCLSVIYRTSIVAKYQLHQPNIGIGSTFPPPYYCWTRSFGAGSIDAAHALIEEAIDEHGPFDGVLGFSQGAAISVSFLLEHKTAYPDEPPPFRFAILYSPTIPCAADEAYCRSVLGTLSSVDQQRLRSGKDKEITQLPEPVRSVTESLVSHQGSPLYNTRIGAFLPRPPA